MRPVDAWPSEYVTNFCWSKSGFVSAVQIDPGRRYLTVIPYNHHRPHESLGNLSPPQYLVARSYRSTSDWFGNTRGLR